MAEQLNTLLHQFDFLNDNRAGMVLNGSIRLDPARNVVELKPDANGAFPTSGDNYIISQLFNPNAVRSWAAFQVDIKHTSDGISQLTGDGYRLHDGTSQWWWDPIAVAWAVTTTHWSPETDVANHIAAFPATTRRLRLVIALTTTDPTLTPTLTAAKVAWLGKVFVFEDMIYRTLIPLIKSCRVIIDFVINVKFPGGTSLDIGAAVKASSFLFNVVDVEAVFNNNSDPGHYNNLLSSYNPTTGIASIATAVPVGQIAFIRLVVQPQVAVENTSQDYTEVEKTPSLQISNIEAVDSQPLSQDDSVVNKATGAAIRIQAPYRFNLRFAMIALAPGGIDLTRILEALVELVENNQLLTSAATGEQNRLWLKDEFRNTTHPTNANLHQSEAQFMILDIVAFKKPARAEQAVITFTPRISV